MTDKFNQFEKDPTPVVSRPPLDLERLRNQMRGVMENIRLYLAAREAAKKKESEK